MTEPISSGDVVAMLFSRAGDADAATRRLRAAGFADVRLSERDGETSEAHLPVTDGRTAPDFAASLTAAGFDASTAERITDAVARGGCLLTLHAGGRVADALAVLRGEDVTTASIAPFDDTVVQTRGEALEIEKRAVASEARVRKEVVMEQRTITVPVAHEELVVERDGAEPLRIALPERDPEPPA